MIFGSSYCQIVCQPYEKVDGLCQFEVNFKKRPLRLQPRKRMRRTCPADTKGSQTATPNYLLGITLKHHGVGTA